MPAACRPALFYNLDIRPDATGSVTVGALQDNGTQTTGRGAPTWDGWRAGGDGLDVVYDGAIAGKCTAPAASGRRRRARASCARRTTALVPDRDHAMGHRERCGLLPRRRRDRPQHGRRRVREQQPESLAEHRRRRTWRNMSPFPGTGEVDVAPTNGNNVVVAVGNRVFVSTDALVRRGPTDGFHPQRHHAQSARRESSRGVAFDPNDPATIYAVLGGFSGVPGRGTSSGPRIGGDPWTDISPPLDLPFNAIALDGSETPTALYAGTDFGVLRSVDGGANWTVLDDIHFPRAPVFELVLSARRVAGRDVRPGRVFLRQADRPVDRSQSRAQPRVRHGLPGAAIPDARDLQRRGCGSRHHSVQRLMGSTGFSVLATPGTPLVIAARRACRLHRSVHPTVRGVVRRPRPSAS